MRKIWSVFLTLALLFAMMVPIFAEDVPAQSNGDSPMASQGCKTLDARLPIGGSQYMLNTSESAILYECNSDTVVYAYNPDQRVEPGSLVKIMSCLLLGEMADPQKEFAVSQSAVDAVPWDAYGIELQAGEMVTMEQLIHAIMLDSANDAVAAGAFQVCGSLETFVELMNQRAEMLGCTQTHFDNPYGFASPDTYSTARDLARITRAAMDVPAFWQAYCTPFYDMPETNLSEARSFSTNNYMLYNNTMFNYYDSTMRGGKVGFTTDDTWHVVENSENNGMHFIVVTLNATNKVDKDSGATYVFGNLEDARTLLDYGYSAFAASTTVCAGQAIAQYPVTGGANDVVLGARESVSSVLPSNMTSGEIKRQITVDQALLKAPLQAGVKVGTVECWYRNFCVGSTDLVTMVPVAVNTAAVPLDGVVEAPAPEDPAPAGNSGIKIVLEVCGAVFLVLLLLFGLFTVRGVILRSRRQRRRDAQMRKRRRR